MVQALLDIQRLDAMSGCSYFDARKLRLFRDETYKCLVYDISSNLSPIRTSPDGKLGVMLHPLFL